MVKKLILITIDCCRRDCLKVYGYDKDILPNVNKLSKESYCFNNAIANGSNTASSFYSLFTSELPAMKVSYAPLPLHKKTFYKILSENNIKTCGIHSNPHLGNYCNYNLGFDDFYDMFKKPQYYSSKKQFVNLIYLINEKILEFFSLKEYGKKIRNIFSKIFKHTLKRSVIKKVESPYLNARNITAKSLEWLKRNYHKNFFLWIHFMDAHTPYFPSNKSIKNVSDQHISDDTKLFINQIINKISTNPDWSKDLDKKKIGKTIEILHNAELNYVDFYIGILIKYLKNLSIYDSTKIILTADHGDEMFEHNCLSHYPSLYDELLRVPLLIKLNTSLNKAKILQEQVQLLDIGPTILNLFKLPKDENYQGRNLVNIIKKENGFKNSKYAISIILHHNKISYTAYNKDSYKFFIMISCRTLDWKLIFDGQTKSIKLFNLKADPGEVYDLSKSTKNNIIDIKKHLFSKILPYIEYYKSEESKIERSARRIFSKK
ncbi:MAG: sulfatase-like hydrolase/transferase [Promethearchaeota archaeon]